MRSSLLICSFFCNLPTDSGVFKEGDLNEIFLLDIYERIKQNEFKTGHDHCNHVLKVQQTLVPSSRYLILLYIE